MDWSETAKQHACKLRDSGHQNKEIAALLGRSLSSVKGMFRRLQRGSRAKDERTTYNRVDVANMLGMTVNEFMCAVAKLEQQQGLPKSARARYAVPRAEFDQWLRDRYFPGLTVEQWVEQARANFLRACFTSRPDREIIQAAEILRVAESVLRYRA